MRRCVFASAALLLFAAMAQAGLTFYADSASFAANTTISFTETFSSVTAKDLDKGLASLTSQGITYAPYATTSNVWVTGHAYTNFGVPVASVDTHVLTATGNEDFMVNIPLALSVTAVGFDTYLNSYGPVTIEVHTSDGWTTTTLP